MENISFYLKVLSKLAVANLIPNTLDKNMWSRTLAEMVCYLISGEDIEF